MPDFVDKQVRLALGGSVAGQHARPTRGVVTVLVFRIDGSVTVTGPGAGDRPEKQIGRWTGDPADPGAVSLEIEGQRYAYRIKEESTGFCAVPRR